MEEARNSNGPFRVSGAARRRVHNILAKSEDQRTAVDNKFVEYVELLKSERNKQTEAMKAVDEYDCSVETPMETSETENMDFASDEMLTGDGKVEASDTTPAEGVNTSV